MTRDELAARIERQIADASAFNATAPVADVLGATLDAVRELDDINGRPEPVGYGMITVAEAARRCGMSAQWIYKRREALPFVVKYESGGVRCSERKLSAWLKRRGA